MQFVPISLQEEKKESTSITENKNKESEIFQIVKKNGKRLRLEILKAKISGRMENSRLSGAKLKFFCLSLTPGGVMESSQKMLKLANPSFSLSSVTSKTKGRISKLPCFCPLVQSREYIQNQYLAISLWDEVERICSTYLPLRKLRLVKRRVFSKKDQMLMGEEEEEEEEEEREKEKEKIQEEKRKKVEVDGEKGKEELKKRAQRRKKPFEFLGAEEREEEILRLIKREKEKERRKEKERKEEEEEEDYRSDSSFGEEETTDEEFYDDNEESGEKEKPQTLTRARIDSSKQRRALSQKFKLKMRDWATNFHKTSLYIEVLFVEEDQTSGSSNQNYNTEKRTK